MNQVGQNPGLSPEMQAPETESAETIPVAEMPKKEGIASEAKEKESELSRAEIPSGVQPTSQIVSANAQTMGAIAQNEPPAPEPIDQDDLDEAGDVNIIERPWLNKIKQILKLDKGNPFKEEEDHEDLEISYLKKRFGKNLKKGD